MTSSTSRSRSMAAPAAAASTSAAVVGRHHRVGRASARPGRAARRAAPGRPAAAGSPCRRRPGAAARPPAAAAPAGPAGVPGAASRVRPIGEPSSSRSSRSRCGSSSVVERGGDLRRRSVRRPPAMTWPGYQGRPDGGLGGDPHRASSPHTSARSRRSSSGRGHRVLVGAARRSAATSLASGTAVGVGVQHQQRVEHRQPQEVQLVGGGLDRLAGLRARGQRRDAARRRLGEVGPQLQQPDQPVVGQVGQPGAQRRRPGRVRSLLTSVKQASIGAPVGRQACHNDRRG